MPSFISKKGIWFPANEKAVNVDTGEIYEGKDREALKIIEKETNSKDGTLGMDVTKDPENIMRARQLGMTVEEFLKLNEPPTPEQIAKEKAQEEAVVTHSLPKRKKGVQVGAGDFGEIPR